MDENQKGMLLFALIMLGMPTLGVVSYLLSTWWLNRRDKRPKQKNPSAAEIRANAEILAADAFARATTNEPLP